VSIRLTQIHHVQITVPPSAETACKHFYGTVLGLEEMPKPLPLRKNGGAWYRNGSNELHLSLEEVDNRPSRRHVCLMVEDLGAAEATLREAGVEIVPDTQPIEGWRRFYVRDPGGNRLEIAARPAR
jgi:catechol 2,3-dioxygenase-like lactoylglutathione lyase family enzyme